MVCWHGDETCQVSNIAVANYVTKIIMFVRRYHYRCVICGRDEVCKLSKDWQRQMGVSSEAAKKPFYNVLVEDSSNRYAAQGIPIN